MSDTCWIVPGAAAVGMRHAGRSAVLGRVTACRGGWVEIISTEGRLWGLSESLAEQPTPEEEAKIDAIIPKGTQ